MTKLDFNTTPYFDDYSKSDNTMKVLYKAGRAVQARELNLAQSIMSGQLESFANHIFKNGSKVSNARSSLVAYDYVRLRNTNPATNLTLNVAGFGEGSIVTGETSNLKAKLVRAINAENSDPATLFVSYQNTAIDGLTKTFIPGENLEFRDENDVVVYKATVRCPSCAGSPEGVEIFPTGKGHLFSLDEGIFYFEGMFINVARQSTIVSKYSYPKGSNTEATITPFLGRKIGLDFIQSVVTSDDDETLLDPSLGYPNATAPGADRYRVNLSLTTRSYDAQDGEGFILLAKINSRYSVEYQKTDSEYADLMDTVAKRSYETNGNYTVVPFTLSWYEHLKKNAADAKGWDLNGSSDNLVALMSPGIAYVRGYRFENISDYSVVLKKARSVSTLPSFIKRFDERSSFLLKPNTQVCWPNPNSESALISPTTVTLFDGLAGAGNNIGSARINDMVLVSGIPNDLSAVYRYSISDLVLAPNKTTNDIKSVTQATTTFNANAVVDSVTLKFNIQNPGENTLIFGLDKANIKSLRDKDNALNGSMSITIRRKLKAVMDSQGAATFSSTSNEFFSGNYANSVCFVTSTANVTRTVKLDANNSTIAPTGLTVNFGSGDAGSTVTVITDVLRTSQKEKKKTLLTHTYTANTAAVNLVNSTLFLGKADAFDLTKVETWDHTIPANPVFIADVTPSYKLENGATDTYYGESKIVQTKSLNSLINNNTRLHVTFRYFDHSGPESYFTVDSYADAINDTNNNLDFSDIPKHTTLSGEVISLGEAIDFRPIYMSLLTTGTVPSQGSTALFDISFYLPRSDIIQVNKDGRLYVKYGIPSESPVLPAPDQDAMVLYQVFLKAYTYSIDDVGFKFIDNKRFTMRDIGGLENRIANVEYYTTLNLLEQSALNANIKDENGLDRFKNGLIADNFQDFQAADLSNVEWKACADRTRRELRPQFKASNNKLNIRKDLSAGVKWHGEVATLPYTEEIASENPYATKHLSINPYLVVSKRGQVVLVPQVDTWADEERLPTVTSSIDTGTDALRTVASAQGLLGTTWGSWAQQNTTTISTPLANGGTSVTRIDQETRNVTNRTVESRTQSYTIDNIVKDVQITPYIRSRTVEFSAGNLKPNTRIYAFFDGQNVTEFCRDVGFGLTEDNAASRLTEISFGAPLYTNSEGRITGEFLIPEGRFFTGKSPFKITDDSTNGDLDQQTTYAETIFFSGGLDVSKQNHTLNITSPVLSTTTSSESRVNTTETTIAPPAPPAEVPDRQLAPAPWPDPQWRDGFRWVWNGSLWVRDPVAQQFFTEEDQFITALDLFFFKVDMSSDNIWVELREMVNGYPAPSAIVHKDYKPSQITFSEDSNTKFRVTFDIPVYLKGGTDYCFVVGGASPETRIWLSKLGQEVVNMPGKVVEQQTTLGSSFRSQNGKTWNAEQYEHIKYTLHRARFTEESMYLEFENAPSAEVSQSLPENPIETQSGSDLVRVFIPSHGLTQDDRFTLNLFDSTPVRITCPDLPPQIGQKMTSATGSGIITEVAKEGAIIGDYTVKLKDMTGVFLPAQGWVAEAYVRKLQTEVLIGWISGETVGTIQVNESTGTFKNGSTYTGYINNQINGIPVLELNKEHIVETVDSLDSVIIQVTSPAQISSRSGGNNIKAFDICKKFETFNVSGSYLAYNAAEDWKLNGIGHGNVGSLFEGDNYTEKTPVSFKPSTDQSLASPMKIASRANEIRVFGINGRKSAKITAGFTTGNRLITPVVDTSGFSIISVSNRIEDVTPAAYNIIPNSSNRFVPETDPINGTEQFKYVTRTVKLANSAQDLVVYLDYYKDVNADFDVYIKTIPVYNAADEGTYPWQKCNIPIKKNAADLLGKTELQITASKAISNWVDEFASFKIKIVGKSKNSAKPPLFYNLRAIAVT